MEEATFQNITSNSGSLSPNVSEKLKQIVIYQGCQIRKEEEKKGGHRQIQRKPHHQMSAQVE